MSASILERMAGVGAERGGSSATIGVRLQRDQGNVDPPAPADHHGHGRPSIQVHFSKAPDVDLIYDLMDRHGFDTPQDVVRGALSFYAWVSEQEEDGARFQIARPAGPVETYELDRPA